ncbi:thioredoxin domain-containing protein [Shewanella sp. 202IG2-18]|uniref:DUF255 domain-containing protein n=1 Tax=Parashewanella hymeniacidonis TaxID=2807618 RepID=UPI00195F7309|nr:DUF255 domain-containing protein [Parashewanella hymeniacidonis]MBM7074426.1 thioredoxin domain-containing protein [Parashewanella hymeniacidonis]
MYKFVTLIYLFSFVSVSANGALNDDSKIQWLQWQPSTFEQAKKQQKLILVNVGLEGCTACNRMAKHTYSNDKVIKLINDNFVSIEVDSQARPDIGERYSDWAWPATIFMLPDTSQVFAMAGNRFPENFTPILEDLIRKYKNGTLKADESSPYTFLEKPIETPFTVLRDRLRKQIGDQFNTEVSGWNHWGVNAEVDGARLRHLYFLAHHTQDQHRLKQAINVSKTFLKTLDPVWGGAYEANIHPSAKNVPEEFAQLLAIPEKRISSQANALVAFATAYQLTGEQVFIDGINNVDRYLDTWMKSASGTWYANQKDTPPALPNDWWPQDYWALDSDAKRRKYGIPPIDHAVYTDKNAEIILAYIDVYAALKDRKYLKKAETAALSLLVKRQTAEGWLMQTEYSSELQQDQRIRALSVTNKPFLSTQAQFGRALLKLYQYTAEEKWLIKARQVARAMMSTLYEQEIGGFWSTVSESNNAIEQRKPLENNAIAGQFFYNLSVFTKNELYKKVAASTIKAVASDSVLNREGKVTAETLLLLETMTAQYVEFTVVTDDKNNKAAQHLYQAGLDQYLPRKLIHYEKPGRYPDLGKPVMFICNPDRCSRPLTKSEQIVKVAKQYQ